MSFLLYQLVLFPPAPSFMSSVQNGGRIVVKVQSSTRPSLCIEFLQLPYPCKILQLTSTLDLNKTFKKIETVSHQAKKNLLLMSCCLSMFILWHSFAVAISHTFGSYWASLRFLLPPSSASNWEVSLSSLAWTASVIEMETTEVTDFSNVNPKKWIGDI